MTLLEPTVIDAATPELELVVAVGFCLVCGIEAHRSLVGWAHDRPPFRDHELVPGRDQSCWVMATRRDHAL